MRPELVIFDCDGVLVDSEPAHNEVLSENLSGYGLDLSPEACWRIFAGGKMTEIRDRAIAMGADLHADWIDEIYGLIHAKLRLGVPAVDGIANLLGHLKHAEVPFCVASNGSEAKMAITLGQNDLLRHFDNAMFSAHTVGIAKPEPGLFLHAAAAHGSDPQRCVVVEDSSTGAKAARAAGIRCYGYAPHGDTGVLGAEGAIVFGDMLELVDKLDLQP